MDAIDATRETIKWLMEFYATPVTLLDAYLNYKYGDNLVTSLPIIEKPLNEFDPWTHEFNYNLGRVIVDTGNRDVSPHLLATKGAFIHPFGCRARLQWAFFAYWRKNAVVATTFSYGNMVVAFSFYGYTRARGRKDGN